MEEIYFKEENIAEKNSSLSLKHLRIANRETKNFYISEYQRVFDVKKSNQDLVYKFQNSYNNKFSKTKTYPVINKESEDMIFQTSKLSKKDLKESFLMKESYESIFSQPIEKIFSKKDHLFTRMTHIYDYIAEKENKKAVYPVIDETALFNKGNRKKDIYFKEETISYLKELFNVSKVYTFSEYHYITKFKISEQSILDKTATLLHITHFNENKKHIDLETQKKNATIIFWLFEDTLVISDSDGKGSW